jgi:hypothetical protein
MCGRNLEARSGERQMNSYRHVLARVSVPKLRSKSLLIPAVFATSVRSTVADVQEPERLLISFNSLPTARSE